MRKFKSKSIRKFIREAKYLARTVVRRFKEDGCTTRAAALAYTTLLSLVPLLTVSFSVLTAFPVFQEIALKIQNFIFENFVAESAQAVQIHLEGLVNQASRISGVGMVFLIATAILMVFNMEKAFNAIWRAEKHRSFISAFLMYWAVLTLTPILIGAGVVTTAYIASLPFISTATEVLGIKKLLIFMTPYLSAFVVFTLFYLAVPNTKVKFRYALIGGFVATVLFEIAKQIFVFYIRHFSAYQLLYGALAAIPIFLIWLYVCWLIILIGAVISAVALEYKN